MYTSNCLPMLWHWVRDKVEEASVWNAWLILLLLHLAQAWAPGYQASVVYPCSPGQGRQGQAPHPRSSDHSALSWDWVRDREKGELELEPKSLC